MSSTYNGSGTTIHTSAALLDDGDRPAAILWRVPEEAIFDSLAAIATALGGTTLTWTALTTAGGAKTLTSNMVISGSEWRFANVLRGTATASFLTDVGCGSQFSGNATFNADFTLSGTCVGTIEDGADVTFEDGADLNFADGADVSFRSGSLAVFASGSECRLERARDLKVAAETSSQVLCMTPVCTGYDSGGETVWQHVTDGVNSKVAWTQMRTPAVGGAFVMRVPGRPGDVITSVVARIEGSYGGGHASIASMTLPLVQLIGVDINGNITVIASQSDGAASIPTVTDAASYDVPHNITLAAVNHTILGSPIARLYVRVFGESGTNSATGTTALHHIVVSTTRNSAFGSGTTEYE